MASYNVKMRRVHHAWVKVEAPTAKEALRSAAKKVSPDWEEYAHDLPMETWDVMDSEGQTLILGESQRIR